MRSRVDRRLEVRAEPSVLFGDAVHDVAQPARDVHACALDRGARAALATADADGARELAAQGLHLGTRTLDATEVVPGLRLAHLVLEVRHACSVCRHRAAIEQRAGIARVDRLRAVAG